MLPERKKRRGCTSSSFVPSYLVSHLTYKPKLKPTITKKKKHICSENLLFVNTKKHNKMTIEAPKNNTPHIFCNFSSKFIKHGDVLCGNCHSRPNYTTGGIELGMRDGWSRLFIHTGGSTLL
jgi:hypothetical protein